MVHIADALAILKQSYVSKKTYCIVKKSRQTISLISSLKDLGFIRGFSITSGIIVVFLSYRRAKFTLRRASLLSKPSQKVFFKYKNLRGTKLLGFYKTNGTFLLTTSSSSKFLTAFECFAKRIGGQPVVVIG